MKATPVIAIEQVNAYGKATGRFYFATPSTLHKGRLSKSLRTWASKAGALKAGNREHNS